MTPQWSERSWSRAAALALGAALALMTAAATAQGPGARPPTAPAAPAVGAVAPEPVVPTVPTPPHVPNRLIVKFRTAGPNAVTLPPAELARRAPQGGAATKAQPPAKGAVPKAVVGAGPDARYEALWRLNAELKVRSAAPLSPHAAAAGAGSGAGAPAKAATPPGTPAKNAAARDQARKALQARNARRARRAGDAAATATASPRPVDLSGYVVLEFEPGGDMEAYRRRYLATPFVESASLDLLLPLHAAPNDPFFSSQGSWNQAEDDLWGLKKINAEAAWAISQGEGVVVAVLDTGLDCKHKDIAANVWTNPGEVAGNGVDDDGNGFIDDVNGFDFFFNDPDPMDEAGHGTHTAGTIAAVGNNGEGILGVAPKAKIMALKGGADNANVSLLAMARAFLYAVENGADVASCSWGPGASHVFSPVLDDVVRHARGAGLAIVFSAGNNGTFFTGVRPNTLRDVLTVGASRPDDDRAIFSNFGHRLGVVAPGGGIPGPNNAARNILSLKASVIGPNHLLAPLVVKDDYLRLSGTSMAAPHVSGVVALLLAKRPELTIDEVFGAIRASCDDVGDPGFDLSTGAGRVNAAAALAVAQPLTVRLTAPADGLTLPGGPVSVAGLVRGARLRDWRLSYAPIDKLSEVHPIGSSRTGPVAGALATWDPAELATGVYLLRLSASDQDGRTYEDAVAVGVSGRPGLLLAGDDRNRGMVAVSKGRVVWTETAIDNFTVGGSIETARLDGTDRRRLADLAPQFASIVDIEGDWLVHDLKTPSTDGMSPTAVSIVLRNLATGSVETLADFPGGHPWPQAVVSTRAVYWTDENDLLFSRELTAGAMPVEVQQRAQQGLTTDGPWVVWSNENDVHALDERDGQVRRITRDFPPAAGAQPFINVQTSVSGDRIAWRRALTDAAGRVMVHDLKTGLTRPVTGDLPAVGTPFVSGPRVVWNDRRQAQQDVSYASLNAQTTTRLTGDLADEFVTAAEGSKVLVYRERSAPLGDVQAPVYDLVVMDAAAAPAFRGRAPRQGGVDFSINPSRDGAVVTLIFDNFLAGLPRGGDQLIGRRDLSIALPLRDDQPGTPARVTLRGHMITALPEGTSASVLLVVGGKPAAVELDRAEGRFLKTVTLDLVAGSHVTATIELVVDRSTPGGPEIAVQLDDLELDLTPRPAP